MHAAAIAKSLRRTRPAEGDGGDCKGGMITTVSVIEHVPGSIIKPINQLLHRQIRRFMPVGKMMLDKSIKNLLFSDNH